MIFDNAEIKQGDVVHDIVFGAGTVETVLEAEHKFGVRFGNRHYTYDAAGVGHFPMKTCFWQDPVGGFIPMKDSQKWGLFVEARKALAQVIFASSYVRDKA